MSRPHNVLCPFCSRSWSTKLATYRCTSTTATQCARVPDPELGKHRGDTTVPDEARIIVRSGKIGQAFSVKPGHPVRCDTCKGPTRPICPNCHRNLPLRFSDAPSRSMAMIGTKASGKSHFIAVVLHELEHQIGPRFRGSLTALDDATRNRIDTDLYPRLYGDGLVLEATQSSRNNVSTREPLVARLTLSDRPSNLVFFDAAGEDLDSVDILELEGRYITQSDGLILLVDPLQIDAVRDDLEGSIELPPKSSDVYAMLGRLASMLREVRGIAPNKPIEVPLAIAISKIDALRSLLPDTHPVFVSPRHDGVFDHAVARNISEALRADAVGWVGARLDSFLKEEFATYSFFGVSALGENPQGGKLRNGVSPHRVEDPVLWMLDQWGAVPR